MWNRVAVAQAVWLITDRGETIAPNEKLFGVSARGLLSLRRHRAC
jgi:hypothetical protein